MTSQWYALPQSVFPRDADHHVTRDVIRRVLNRAANANRLALLSACFTCLQHNLTMAKLQKKNEDLHTHAAALARSATKHRQRAAHLSAALEMELLSKSKKKTARSGTKEAGAVEPGSSPITKLSFPSLPLTWEQVLDAAGQPVPDDDATPDGAMAPDGNPGPVVASTPEPVADPEPSPCGNGASGGDAPVPPPPPAVHASLDDAIARCQTPPIPECQKWIHDIYDTEHITTAWADGATAGPIQAAAVPERERVTTAWADRATGGPDKEAGSPEREHVTTATKAEDQDLPEPAPMGNVVPKVARRMKTGPVVVNPLCKQVTEYCSTHEDVDVAKRFSKAELETVATLFDAKHPRKTKKELVSAIRKCIAMQG